MELWQLSGDRVVAEGKLSGQDAGLLLLGTVAPHVMSFTFNEHSFTTHQKYNY